MKKEKDINLDEWELEFQQRDYHPVLMADQWCRALYNHFASELGLDVPVYDYMFTGTSKGYLKPEKKEKLIKIFTKALEDQKYVDFIFSKTLKRIEELNDFASNALKKIDNKKELAKIWKEFNEIFLKVIPWFWIPYYPSEYNIFTDKVKEGFEKYKDKIESITDLNNALSIITFPIKEILLQKEQADFYKLVALAEKGEDYKKDAENYLKKYAFLKTFIELPIEPLSYKELVDKIKEAIKDNALEEYELQQSKKKENKKIANKIWEIVKEDKKLAKDIENARELGWLLSFSVEKALCSLSRLIPFYKNIAEALRIPYQDWVHLTIDEVCEGLEGKEVNKEEIAKRKISYVYVMEKGKSQLISGDIAKKKTEWIDKTVTKIDEDITEIKGQPTSPGKVTGKVRFVPRAQDSKELQEGEILVCSMTSPDYVPAMKRAGAIVTDEGGLLCHAAIVSRELGRPCIVGTKIATKVLKDGDLVEVDANRGLVKILKQQH